MVARNAFRKDCAVLAERIRARVEAHAFTLPGGESIQRTCSIGFAFYPLVEDQPEHVAWEQVVDLADSGLYAAKRAGRNAWVGLFSNPGLTAEQISRTPAMGLGDLLTAGKLSVVTNLPEGQALEWGQGGT